MNRFATQTPRFFGPDKAALAQLVAALVIGFVVQLLLPEAIERWLMFTPALPDSLLKPWSYLSYAFLHAGFFHLLNNVIWMYFIGMILEDLIGKKPIYTLFVGGAIAGALMYQGIFQLAIAEDAAVVPSMLGASGGVSAIILAAGLFAPRYRVFLFGIWEVELRYIVGAKILFDVLGLSSGANTGGYLAHFGGMAFALAYITEMKGMWNWPFSGWLDRLSSPNKSKPKRSAKVEINRKENNPKQAEIDAILDKISQSGYDSLTAKEKETLFKASQS